MADSNLGKILLVEDEPALAEILKETLQSKGFEVNYANTLSKAKSYYLQGHPDIIVIDVMLPDGNGFEWISSIRQRNTWTPVLFLTSLSQPTDVVKGFEIGGNDYVKKPFSIAELVVRIQSLLKRGLNPTPSSPLQQQNQIWEIGKFTFHYPAGELIDGTDKRQLTSREADLLCLLLLKSNESLSRNDILQALWGNTDYFSGRSLDVFVTKLRRYFSTDPSVKIINIRGLGYKMIY